MTAASGIAAGDRFGRLVVVGPAFRSGKHWRVPARCECGASCAPITTNLLHRTRPTQSCRRCATGATLRAWHAKCGHVPAETRVGQTFGRLTIERLVSRYRSTWRVAARCACGKTCEPILSNVTAGTTRSCGCLLDEARDAPTTHGWSRHPLYQTWAGMLARCYDARLPVYRSYGGRGIGVCERWRGSFASFAYDMVARPSIAHSIDRRDNDRGYDCGACDDCRARTADANVRWATRREQARNTRRNMYVELNGQRRLIADVYSEHGVSRQLFYQRIRSGWPLLEAATRPPAKRVGKIGLARLSRARRIEIARKGHDAAPGSARVSLRERLAAKPDRAVPAKFRRKPTVMLTVDGVTRPLVEWCRERGVQPIRARMRLRAGLSPEIALSTSPLPRGRKPRTERTA